MRQAFRNIHVLGQQLGSTTIARHISECGTFGVREAGDRLAAMLGHPLRTYPAFAEELVAPDAG